MKNVILENKNYQKYLLVGKILEDEVDKYLENLRIKYLSDAFVEMFSFVKGKKEFFLEKISNCTERERDIILLLLSGKNPDLISKNFSLTKERIMQIFFRALKRKCFLLTT